LYRTFYGETAQKTHWTWDGPDVGLVAWGDQAFFGGTKGCTYNSVGVRFSGEVNTSSLHNDAKLIWVFSVTRSDGKRFALGGGQTTRAKKGWWAVNLLPNNRGYDYHVVPTPPGTWLVKGSITTVMLNTGAGSNGVPFATETDTVTFHQKSEWC